MTTVPGLGSLSQSWTQNTGRRLLRMRREPATSGGVVTAFRDGQVTLRSNRRTDGFTEAIKEIGYQQVHCGDLVVHSMDGFAGAIGVSESDGKMSPVANIYEVEGDARYFAYVLRVMAWSGYVQSLAKGIRERSTSFDHGTIADLVLPEPPVEEQRRIADFLDDRVARIDQITAARQQQSSDLAVQFASERQLAVRGLDQPSGGSPAPSWVGRIHHDWSTRRSGQIAEFFAGVGFPPDEQGGAAGHLPLLKVSDLASADDLRRVGTAANWITQEQATKLGVHPAPTGTILFPKVGAALLTNSRAITTRSVTFDNNVMGMHFREGDDRYWLHVLHCIDMGAVTNPGPVPSINRENVASLPVPCPPRTDQARIAAELDSALATSRGRQAALTEQIALLQEYKQSLITAAVTGEFDVTTASTRIPE